MAKIKTAFFCQNCGYETVKWAGLCPSCGQWNTFVEEIQEKRNGTGKTRLDFNDEKKTVHAVSLKQLNSTKEERITSGDAELDRVLGGGIVPGSLVLVAGEPGIGKSTLFLQLGLSLKNHVVLFVSGEESAQQVRMRADRLMPPAKQSDRFFLLTETSTQAVFQEIKKLKPDLVIVDSIQTMQTGFIESSPGSVSQIRECTAEFQRFAKETNTPVFLIGHITKEGSIAGPKILEHMVDTVLQFEGDRHYAYRILRTLKNRFGSASELGIYEMTANGMDGILNPSEVLITNKDDNPGGIAIAATLEGMRPLLVEVQALVSHSAYGTPQRTANGFDSRRLQLLLAVLEKRGGFQLGARDVFLNIAGGFKIEDPSTDLAVICALLSSYEDQPLPTRICFAGEVGLSGEIRAVERVDQRIAEAGKLGFEKIIISRYNRKTAISSKGSSAGIEIIPMARVEDLYRYLFSS